MKILFGGANNNILVIFRVHVYEDVHGLGNVPVEMDSTINALLWFEEHTG